MPSKKATKKAPAKKTPAKKAASAPVKKVAAPVKNAANKAPVKRVSKTSITAQVDIGFSNILYVRGEGAGLSWDKGVAMENVDPPPYDWSFESTKAKGEVTFKFLVNDDVWAEGDNITVEVGSSSISSPLFQW